MFRARRPSSIFVLLSRVFTMPEPKHGHEAAGRRAPEHEQGVAPPRILKQPCEYDQN
jgi:hypothetical protein